MAEHQPAMKQIRDEVVRCTKCPLHKSRILPVVGEGSHDAAIVFVGEAPGASEDKAGRPFCGAAGKILDELITSIGLQRQDVYITNILKSRPPGNRDPKPEEIAACTPYLLRQMEIIKPKAIACLGRFSAKFIMEQFGLTDQIRGISQMHGQIFRAEDRQLGAFAIIPLYHPATVTYNARMKEVLLKDFHVLKQFA